MNPKQQFFWTVLLVAVGTVLGGGVYLAGAQMGGSMGGTMPMMDPYLPEDQVMAMKQMMMTMKPDTLEASIERGQKLFNDTTLGKNKSGQSCASCHSEGGTVGGASEMEWKGMKMKVAIPTLKGAAAHFPKAMGPGHIMVVTLGGMNNLCTMAFLKGMPLDLNSQAATDLAAYVTSFSTGRRLEPGAMKIVPTPVPGAM